MRTFKLSESELPQNLPHLQIIDEDILMVFEDEVEIEEYLKTYASLMFEPKYDEEGKEIPQT